MDAQPTSPTPSPVVRPWAQILEQVIACPSCTERNVDFGEVPTCRDCGWTGKRTGGVADFVDESKLGTSHRAELEAQHNAVGDYYENEDKLCCHWDRMSAEVLPSRLAWPTGLVLDLGCGTGSAGAPVRRAGAKVVGADLSVACLNAARRRLDAVVRTDAARLPFADNVFDGVLARGALHHLHDAEAAIREAARVVKPGGRAVFLDPREFAWLEPIKDRLREDDHSFTHDHHAYSTDEYRALIERDFVVEETFTEHPFGVLLASGLDLFPLPSIVPRRLLAKGLYRMDTALNRTPLARVGHLLVVTARAR